MKDNAGSLFQDRDQLLDQKKRGPHVDGEERVEVFDRCLLDRGGFGHSGVGDQNIEPFADDFMHLGGKLVRTL